MRHEAGVTPKAHIARKYYSSSEARFATICSGAIGGTRSPQDNHQHVIDWGALNMKRFAILASILLALPAAAAAQQTPGPFQGFYMGASGGFDHYELSADIDLGNLDAEFDGYSVTLDGLSGDGAAGEVFVGYHFGLGSTIIAVEGFGRLSSASMSASASDGIDTVLIKAEAKESYGGAARLGMKVARSTGVYGRIGWVNTKFETTLDDSVDVISESQTEDAIQIGGGIETMVSARMALRAEYLVEDYGEAGLGEGISLDNSSFRAGFVVRF